MIGSWVEAFFDGRQHGCMWVAGWVVCVHKNGWIVEACVHGSGQMTGKHMYIGVAG